MISYSFSTVLMTLVSSNLVLILLTICFCNPKLLTSIGYKALALFLCLILLRFILPFQFPFAHNLPLSNVFSRFISFFRYGFYNNGVLKLSPWKIFELIWIAGFLILLIREIYVAIQYEKYIKKNGVYITQKEPYASLLKRICTGKKNPFQIICLPGRQVPKLYGIFHPCILLSDDLELTEKELYYTLCHETSHYFHHDVLLKCGIQLICMAYWWNPCSYFLKQQLDVIIEMRVDKSIVQNNPSMIAEYTACLVKITEIAIEEKELKSQLSASLFKGTKEVLLSRYHMMSAPKKNSTKFIDAVLLAIVIGIFSFSYTFIWEAQYFTPEVAENTFELSSDTSYAISSGNGTYFIYCYGYLVDEIDSLQNYSLDIPVYDSLEEVPAELKPTVP